jgi:hypothetical protein
VFHQLITPGKRFAAVRAANHLLLEVYGVNMVAQRLAALEHHAACRTLKARHFLSK